MEICRDFYLDKLIKRKKQWADQGDHREFVGVESLIC